MNFPDRIRRLRESIAQISADHRAKHSDTNVTKAYQNRSTRKDPSFDLKQLCKRLKLKGPEALDSTSATGIDITSADIFLTVDQRDTTSVKWADISVEERKTIMATHLETTVRQPPLTQPVIDLILDMVEKGRLNRKSDVSFDEVNKKIISIPVLKYDDEANSYYINLEEKAVRDKKRKDMKKFMKK